MRHQFAAVHELARIEMLAGLPGETLAALAERMRRETLGPGDSIDLERARGRVYVVISGMLQTGSGRMLRPGEMVGRSEPVDAPLRALLPTTVASCDLASFDELVAPAAQG